ncbi:hypothetical protein [Halorhodospira halophila]|uniref:hypothetical protein n=1 Tax=Halorhodospira halophila TaxID=1053 RepID=UPI001913C202|nr:hypothetical protein [Halorhodospira halophila]MBK5936153.1 hypothetical protein [Halorhodospira halophila]
MNTFTLRTAERNRLRITLDRLHGELLALRLGFEPETPEGYVAVHIWLQAQVDDLGDWGVFKIREQLHALVLRALIDPQLEQALDDWLDLITPATPAPLRSFRRLAQTPATVPTAGRVTVV